LLKILIIADDLTGAADCAAACGPNALVVLDDSRGVPGAEVVAFDANTRSMTAEHAAAETARIVRSYPASIVYKKIDSTLRGHIGAEIAAALDAYRNLGHPDAIAVVAPAFPAMGRNTKGGRQYVRGVPLENGDLTGLPNSVISDAETDEHLRMIAAKWIGRDVLWVGSAGLMLALTAHQPKRPPLPPPKVSGPIVFAVGSVSERSRQQAESLRESGIGSDVILAGEPEALARQISGRRDPIGALVLTGGDTARAVLRALEITALRVLGEVETGVPILITEDPRSLPVVTKAGDFGNRETLVRCRAALKRNRITTINERSLL
jgi:D-threonate/D-erythronate kinase